MSRIGKAPIEIPKGVEVTISNGLVTVKGAKGTLTQNAGSTFTIYATPGSSAEYVGVWIDANNDGTFNSTVDPHRRDNIRYKMQIRTLSLSNDR